MKMIVTLTIQVANGSLTGLVNELHQFDCDIIRLTHLSSAGDAVIYELDIVYDSSMNYAALVKKISASKDDYRIINESNIIEKEIHGGLLSISGKLQVDSIADYEMKVIGAASLIMEKAASGQGRIYSGISNSIGLINGLMAKPDTFQELSYLHHAAAERDSVILHRFSGINATPLIVRYQHFEDIIKSCQGIEPTFSAFRFMYMQDIDDMDLYDQLYGQIGIPSLSYYYDELPLCLVIEIIRQFGKNNINFQENNIGIIGINSSALRMTRLLLSLGCQRVLGYDNNEKLMLIFEKAGGLATTPENIFNNSDLLILFKNHYTIDEFQKIMASQYLISLIDEDEIEKTTIMEKGIKVYVPREAVDTSYLYPGLLKGMMHSGKKCLGDDDIINLAQKIHPLCSDAGILTMLFTDIHSRIASFI